MAVHRIPVDRTARARKAKREKLQQNWEDRLHRMKLSMSRGLSHWLVYGWNPDTVGKRINSTYRAARPHGRHHL